MLDENKDMFFKFFAEKKDNDFYIIDSDFIPCWFNEYILSKI